MTVILGSCLGIIIIAVLSIVAVVGVLFFLIDDEDVTTSVAVSDEEMMDDSVELVELLIDGGCKVDEVFNEEDESCSLKMDCQGFECATWADDLIVQLEEQYGSLTEEESVAIDLEDRVLAQYDINLEDEVLETDANVSDEVLNYHSSLWYSYAWLIPEYARSDMNKFEVFDSGSTLAYVTTHDDYAEQWTIGMNRDNLELASETMVTYIHEFSHLLSLRNTEIDYYADEDTCEGLFYEDYCYYDDAYIKYFYDEFYTHEQEETDDYFVSDYAMSSIAEDFAETFAHFVLTPQPSGTTVKDEKIRFFYDFEDLVELRAEILGRAATWLDRTVVD